MKPRRILAWIDQRDAEYVARVLPEGQSEPVVREFGSAGAAYIWVIAVAEVKGGLIDWTPCIPPPEPPLLSC